MKHEKMTFSLCLVAVLLGSLVSFCCLMCLAVTYSMPCETGLLIALCCIVSGGAVAAMSVKKSWLITLNVFLIYMIVMFWQHEALMDGFSAALYHITTVFEKCFRNITVVGNGYADMNLMFAALAVPLSWLTVWTICKESYCIFVILACTPFMILSLIVVNLAPNAWLVLLTAALMLLIMSDSVRVRSANEGGKLLWRLILPLAALFTLLAVLSPAKDYTRSDWSQALQQIAEGKLDVDKWRKHGAGGKMQDDVDLNKIGPRRKTGAHALAYCADSPISYLRGMSYGEYHGGVWEGVPLQVYEELDLEQDLLTCDQYGRAFLRIKTSSKEKVCYTAYHPSQLPQGSVIVYDAYVENRGEEIEYISSYLGGSMNATWESKSYEKLLSSVYLQVPEDLQEQLRQVLEEAGLTNASAEDIAAYVRSNGTYDLNTPRVPDGEDFVLYFLTQSRQGYCVHFASSAVLLLRTAGIPARYVTGYSVEGLAGQWNQVSQDEAHAWVEYYADGAGWQYLDPTPSGWREALEEDPEDEQTPPEDDKPDEPDEPIEPDKPDEPDEPEKTPHNPNDQEDTSGDGTKQTVQERSEGPRWYWLLLLPLLILAIVLRRVISVSFRRSYCKKAEPNQRALRLWVWMVRLYKAEHRRIPEELICLAEKAKFSQHELLPAEIAQMEHAVAEQIMKLKKQPILRRLWHQYGLVLY